MLRRFLHQPDNGKDVPLQYFYQLIDRYCAALRKKFPNGVERYKSIYRIEAWAGGFKDSLNELEQSKHAAEWFGSRVRYTFEEDMNQQELDEYRCHVFFYKSAFVRVFSILDKLGYFLNELLELHTEQVKPRYSYFTVLRQMGKVSHLHPLFSQLQQIKTKYKEPLNILRKRRNVEIHFVNVEMLDDLHMMKLQFTENNHIEDIPVNVAILGKSYQMVFQTLNKTFEYCLDHLPKK